MLALRELQREVLAELLGGGAAGARHVRPTALAAERRLEIYRHNVQASLTEALRAVYPTVAELVGRGFFRFAAQQYIARHPSRSGNLHAFGSELAAFLQGFEPAATLPYLADMARFEWCWHAVFHAEAAAFDARATLALLAGTPDDARGRLVMRWQPAAALLRSPYPVLALWRWHQLPPAQRPPIDLDAGPEAVLLRQVDGDVRVHALDPADHALLAALQSTQPLAQAAAAALALDPAYALAQALGLYATLGVLLPA
jgi:hypothetical protein